MEIEVIKTVGTFLLSPILGYLAGSQKAREAETRISKERAQTAEHRNLEVELLRKDIQLLEQRISNAEDALKSIPQQLQSLVVSTTRNETTMQLVLDTLEDIRRRLK